MPADVNDEGCSRSVPGDLRFEVGKREAQIVTVAIDVFDAAARGPNRQRLRHEGVRRAQDAAVDLCKGECGERSPCPGRHRNGRQPIPFRPGLLEGLRHRSLRPDATIEDLVPERVQSRAVTWVEPDRELIERNRRKGCGHRGETLLWKRTSEPS